MPPKKVAPVAQANKKANPTDVYVGTRIRFRRMQTGITQQKLGDALGLTFQQVQKYEKGTNRVGASRLQQIARILSVPESFFFDGAPGSTTSHAPSDPSIQNVANFMASADGALISDCFPKIKDPSLRRQIAKLIERLSETN